ncbi:hypothetical protein ACFV0L_02435 [Streptosporangium canum]|uniref:hypothetical protein n=1 Tax=Streptosporangium canum TaxID=324952 RepID=UPI00367D8DBF
MIVETAAGKVRGIADGRVTAFRDLLLQELGIPSRQATRLADIPAFLLGTAAAWRDAPMLDGDPPPDLVSRVRRSWIGFVRHGDPGWERGAIHHLTTSKG